MSTALSLVTISLTALAVLQPARHPGVTPSVGSSGARSPAVSAIAPLLDRPEAASVYRPPPQPAVRAPRRTRGSLQTQPNLPVPATPSAELQSIVSKGGALGGEHMVGNPNIFTGASTALPKLGQDEELELVRQAWFFVAAADAQREEREALREADVDDEYVVIHHELLLRRMRERASSDSKPASKVRDSRVASGDAPAPGSLVELCDQLPTTMSDTEFRLREALGRGAYNKLFVHNQGLIYYEVNKLFPNWRTATVMEKADLLQEGSQGLLRAIRLFDPARAVRFSTYACWHVRSYILRAVRDKLHVVRLPQNLQLDMIEIRKARYRYAVENQGHVPSPRELASTLLWPTARVEKALAGLEKAHSVSLDDSLHGASAPAGSDAGRQPLLNRVPSARHSSVASENALYHQQLRATLSQAMRERDPRRVQLIRLRYGMEDGTEWSFPQLGARFNMTASAAKGLVHQELKFLRRERKQVLQEFM